MTKIIKKSKHKNTAVYDVNPILGNIPQQNKRLNFINPEDLISMSKGGLLILGTEKYVEKKLKSGKRGEESLKRVVDSLRLSGYKFLGYSVDP
ncbi:MAG: hypothetical protein ACRCWQ_07585, partial [Bacilli bacterium]